MQIYVRHIYKITFLIKIVVNITISSNIKVQMSKQLKIKNKKSKSKITNQKFKALTLSDLIIILFVLQVIGYKS